MSAEVFIDSNILVYAYDESSPGKQSQAQDIISQGIIKESAVLSPQVLGEFFSVVTRKIKNPMTSKEAANIVKTLAALPIIEIDFSLVIRAIDTHKKYKITYWDALILSAAERAHCKFIYTEDLSHHQTYRGIQAVNPFI